MGDPPFLPHFPLPGSLFGLIPPFLQFWVLMVSPMSSNLGLPKFRALLLLPLGLSLFSFAHLSLGVLDLCLQPLDHAGQLIDLIPCVAQVVTVLASCHPHLLILWGGVGRGGCSEGSKVRSGTTASTELGVSHFHGAHFVVHESHPKAIYTPSQPASAHLGLIPGLSISPTAPGNLFILGLDFGDDSIQVQVPAVVHLHDD